TATGKSICGTVFFDVNFNGVFDNCVSSDDDDHHGGDYRDDDNDNHYDGGSHSGGDWEDHRGSWSDRFSDRGSCTDYGDRSDSRSYDNDNERCAEDFGL